jgi:hypothetical protein
MTNTAMELPSLDGAKNRARRLRTRLARDGVEIGHGQALEIIASEHGFRDWNTLHAAIGNRLPGAPVDVGQTVTGAYLGMRFRGEVRGVRSVAGGDRYRLTIRFDEPVDVSAFPGLEVKRRQISATIRRDGRTVERTSTGTPHLMLDL